MTRIFNFIVVLSLLISSSHNISQGAGKASSSMNVLRYQDERLQIEWLFAEEEVHPGDEVLQAFRINLSPGWHIYWRHAGDSGTPPRIDWLEPNNWHVSEFLWPPPARIEMPPLVNFGYENEVYLPFSAVVPADLTGESVVLSLDLDWLVCQENCIPGQATFTVEKPISLGGDRRPSAAAAVLEFARDSYPDVHRDWRLLQDDPAVWKLVVQLPEPADQWRDFDFFPYEATGVDNQGYEYEVQNQQLVIMLPTSAVPASQDFAGVLQLTQSPAAAQSLAYDTSPSLMLRLEEGATATSQTFVGQSLAAIILFALLGGLILNLMPCVLPVLSIKLMQLLGQDRNDRQAALKGSLMYTLGVELSFLLLAGVLILIKAAGTAAGWGFQLQSPYFVGALACLFFFLGLNFLGVISPWDALTRLGNLESKKKGHWQHFSSGILAVIVASPCTAPFMGVSIGYALAQPAWISLLLFAVLGLGFALPFLILGVFPQSLRFLPKPGAWMETLRQFMAFPLFLTVLWLLWVLAQQSGNSAILLILSACLLIAFAAWLEKRLGWRRRSLRILSWVIVVVLVGAVLRILPSGKTAGLMTENMQDRNDELWQSFSPELLAALRVDHPVFIDFTAAWCVTCQVNKRLVLSRQDVLDAFAEYDFKLIRADWTDYNPVIAQTLESFGRNGVPLYVIYHRGQDTSAIILPEILTSDMVLEAVTKTRLQGTD